ncbi:MAG: hypothetical protein WC679_13660 [Bacteroidales bacterium]|jgi:tetratricopeptide (TPR) repeat protein
MKNRHIAIIIIFACIISSLAYAQSFDKAQMLLQYGLSQEAKIELINIVFGDYEKTIKAKAYYLLGNIAFDENKVSVALETWKELYTKYPESSEAIIVKDRIKDLTDIVGDISKETIANAIAVSYLRNGDFWSKGKSDKFLIDSSWIPNIETAVKWYDKVIFEYPNTTAARIAYQSKLKTILGWEETGKYGQKYGIKESFSDYKTQLLDTFDSFEKEYPEDSSLQAFRYQIAQLYWHARDWDKTREWLNIIIEKAGNGDSFYKDLAQRRLLEVEY